MSQYTVMKPGREKCTCQGQCAYACIKNNIQEPGKKKLIIIGFLVNKTKIYKEVPPLLYLLLNEKTLRTNKHVIT